MKQIGIPKIFWDSFEFAVSTQAKRLAKDVADSLGQDAGPLIAEIQKEKIGVYLFEDPTLETLDLSEMRCGHTMPVPGAPCFRTLCSEPVVWSTNPVARPGACLYHSLNPELRDATWKTFSLLEHDGERYYLSKEDGTIHQPNPTKSKTVPTIGFVEPTPAFPEEEPEIQKISLKKIEIDGRSVYLDSSNDKVYDLKFTPIGQFNRIKNVIDQVAS